MNPISRRNFVISASAVVASLPFLDVSAFANPLGLPLGIQLYSVRQQMVEDFDAALAGVRAAGYTEVEAAALPKKSASEIRASLDKAGLRCVSAHHSIADLQTKLDEVAAFDKQLGVKYIICPGPGYRTPRTQAPGSAQAVLTLDDWKYNAEQFNQIGEKLAAMGITFGYHNHSREFRPTEGQVPYLELLRLTDPRKVTFELDCGWAMVAGVNPADLMREHPHRFSMVHVKDFKLPGTPSYETREAKVTELGLGSIDYKPIFAQAAKNQHIMHAFVEQEAFDMPWQQALKVDADYLRSLPS
ncbi:MAG: sugar phosphate isomerase/epimerase family protein [Janthinobacterium lividum]